MAIHERKSPPQNLVSVYEAVNDTLKEIYLGTSNLLSEQLVRDFASSPPAPVAHWTAGQRIVVNIVEYSIPAGDAERFIAHYASSAASAGWKTLREGAR
jgi:hypothetical protein